MDILKEEIFAEENAKNNASCLVKKTFLQKGFWPCQPNKAKAKVLQMNFERTICI